RGHCGGVVSPSVPVPPPAAARRPGRIGPPAIRAAATVAPSIAVPPTIAPIVSHRICHLRWHGDGTGAAAVIVQEHDRRLGRLAVDRRLGHGPPARPACRRGKAGGVVYR